MTLRIVPVTIPAGKSMSDPADCSGSIRIVAGLYAGGSD